MSPSRSKPSPAVLELHDILVAVGTPATDDEEHDTLDSYEYKGPTSKNEAACWVPVLPGSRFCVHVGYDGVSPPYPDAGLQFQVYIDGLGPVSWGFVPPTLISERISQITNDKPVTVGDIELTGREMEDGSVRPFCFSIRQTTDKDEDMPPPNLSSFGEVEVRVWWAVEDPDVEFSPLSWEFDLKLLSNPVNEKFKKVQHRYTGGLDQAEAEPDVGARDGKSLTRPLQKVPFLFCFKYRDAEWLKAERIIPRPKGDMVRKAKSQPPAKRRKVTVERKSSRLKNEPLC
ncbi:hypothetical protein FRC08_007667 [Ceratobasidium sp. 394]|nr:hypothetical protein FRC08_007667 [Ceratobasidium sp. 394]